MGCKVDTKITAAASACEPRIGGPRLNGRELFPLWIDRAVCASCLRPNAPLKVYCAECERKARELAR